MKRPYIVCHMMTSLDGRIDCAMTEKIHSGNQYYETLEELNTPSTISGRVTAEMEMALPGKFSSDNRAAYGKDGWSRKTEAPGYEIVLDTNGTLLWNDDSEYDTPHLIVMSQKVSKEYLDYLDSKNISWIVAGKDHIDLPEALKIMSENFGIDRAAVVGGGNINASFLNQGLIDEISVVMGPAIDGRQGMVSVFDGLDPDSELIHLELKDVRPFEDGTIWLRYLPVK